jgi:hypothetical protein
LSYSGLIFVFTTRLAARDLRTQRFERERRGVDLLFQLIFQMV